MTFRSLPGLALVVMLALSVAACGDSSKKSSSTSGASADSSVIATVAGIDVKRSDLDSQLTQQLAQLKKAGQKVPAASTQQYKQIKQALVARLVQKAEIDAAAKERKIVVSDADVTKQLDKIKKANAYTNGKFDDAKWKKALASSSTTEDALKGELVTYIEQQKLTEVVTKDVKVTDAQVRAYYVTNKATEFTTKATREVRHILVKQKTKADTLYAKLASSDAQFAALAKANSLDGSKSQGGSLGSITKGSTVAPFDKVAFSIATGTVSKPVKSQFGWHLIEATKAVVPANVRALDAAAGKQIRAKLLTQAKQTAVQSWFAAYQKKVEKGITYAKGYAPPKTSTSTSTTGTSDTLTATTSTETTTK